MVDNRALFAHSDAMAREDEAATRCVRYVIKSTRGYYARIRHWTNRLDEAQHFTSREGANNYAVVVMQLCDADYAIEEVT